MDSDDDNSLIIDESPMEVDMESTQENQCENETVQPMATATSSQPEKSAPIDLTVQKFTHQTNGTHKEKDRHSEKRKSKDEKRKPSTANKDKKVTVSTKKTQYIRVSEAIFKQRVLNITGHKHQLFNMRFHYRRGILTAELPTVYPAPAPFPDLNLTQLLNWPDIKIAVVLDHLHFVHEVKQNCERSLVFGDDELVGIDIQKNPTATRYLQKVKSTKTYPMINKEMFNTYVTSLMEAAPLYEITSSKLPEIEQTFRKILDDVATVPLPSIQSRMTHSRFLNEQKYTCIFDESSGSTSSNKLKVRLRETINPEVNFSIKKCYFQTDELHVWKNGIPEFFEDIFIRRTNHMKTSLRDRFKKCLILKCEPCNEVFEGALWAVKLKDHIKQKHFVPKKWSCVKCRRTWDQFELMLAEWKHECTN